VSAPHGDLGLADDEHVPVRLELLLMQPEVRADRSTLERLLHPAFAEIGASGHRWARDALVEAIVASSQGYVAPQVVDRTGRQLADGVVLVTYSTRRAGAMTHRSSVWLHTEDGWQVVFHQATAAG